MKSCRSLIEPCTRRLSRANPHNVQRSVNNEVGDHEVFKQSVEASPVPRIIPSNSIKKDSQISQLTRINEEEDKKVTNACAKHEDVSFLDSRIHNRSEMRNGANCHSQNNQLKDPIHENAENNENSVFQKVNSNLHQTPKFEPPNTFEMNEDNVQKLNDCEKANKDESSCFEEEECKMIQSSNVNTPGGSQPEREQQNDSKVEQRNLEECEIGVFYMNSFELRNHIMSDGSKIKKPSDLEIESGGNETNLFINTESRLFTMVNPEPKTQILKEASQIEDFSLVLSAIVHRQAPFKPGLPAKDPSLRETLLSVVSISLKGFAANLKDSSINESSKKKNPFLKTAEKSRILIKSQSSYVPRSSHENLYAKRYGISIFEQDLLNLRKGSAQIGSILNFYLRYLEERVTKGLGILKTSSMKTLSSDFYDLLCTTGDLKDFQKYFDSSDQKPIIERYERIIFLVNSSATNRWYIVIYKKDKTNKKTLNILTPEEPSKQGSFSVNIILNFQEKNDIVSNIFEYFAKDYVEQTSQRLASNEVDENYISDIPACQDPRDYGFHVLEMMRRAVFGYELGTAFENPSLVRFRNKFCEFIKYFGKQTGPELKFDHNI